MTFIFLNFIFQKNYFITYNIPQNSVFFQFISFIKEINLSINKLYCYK